MTLDELNIYMRDKYDFDGAGKNPYSLKLNEQSHALAAWQMKEIRKSLKEADAGDFATDEHSENAAKKYTNWRPK